MSGFNWRGGVADGASACGVGEKQTKAILPGEFRPRITDQYLIARGCRTGLHNGERLGMYVMVNEISIRFGLGNALRHGDCFGCGGRLIK